VGEEKQEAAKPNRRQRLARTREDIRAHLHVTGAGERRGDKAERGIAMISQMGREVKRAARKKGGGGKREESASARDR